MIKFRIQPTGWVTLITLSRAHAKVEGEQASLCAVVSQLCQFQFPFLSFFLRNWWERREIETERERERERERPWFVIPLIHWLIFICAFTRGQTHNLGISGWCSNQLSYLARYANFLFIMSIERSYRHSWLFLSWSMIVHSWRTVYTWKSVQFEPLLRKDSIASLSQDPVLSYVPLGPHHYGINSFSCFIWQDLPES